MKCFLSLFFVLASLTVQAQVGESQKFLNRDYAFNVSDFFSGILSSDKKYSTGSKYKYSGYMINLDFNRNYGFFELGGKLYYSVEKTDRNQEDLTTTELGVHLDYNFKENKTGEALVPFVQVGLYSRNVKDKIADLTYHSTPVEFAGGVKYFPFNDYVALIGGVKYRYIDADVTGGTDYKYNYLGLMGSVSVYF